MESDKRNIWLGVLFLILLSAAIAWFTFYAVIRQPGNPWQHLPENTQAVIRINGPAFFGKAEIGTSGILREMAVFPSLTLPVSWLLRIDSVYRQSPEKYGNVGQQEILLALFPLDQRWEVALLSDASDARKRKAWMDILRAAGAVIEEGADGGLTIRLDPETSLYGLHDRNLWAMSGSLEGVAALKASLRRTVSVDKQSEWENTQRKTAVSLFVNTSLWQSFLRYPGNIPETEEALLNEDKKMLLDILFKRNEIYLSGYQTDSEKENTDQYAFSNLMSWPGEAPEGITAFSTLGFLKLAWHHKNEVDSLTEEYPLHFSIVRFHQPSPVFQLYPLDSTSLAFVSGFRKNLEMDPALPSIFFKKMDSILPIRSEGDSLKWQVIPAGKTLLLSRNEENIRKMAANVQAGRTFAAHPARVAMADMLPDSAIHWGFSLLSTMGGDRQENQGLSHQLAWAEVPGKHQVVTMVLNRGEASAVKRPVQRQSLAGRITHRPFPVWDHRNKHYNVLVADDRNVLTLFSPQGEILWDYQMDDRLMGDIQVVDAYRNSKFQYLFNTASKMYLLDILGKDVEGFPLSLPVSASNALVALDYDGRKDYRIFIAGQDGLIRNYDIKGKEVDGWKKPQMNARVSAPIQYLAMYGKDYIIIADEDGEVIMTDRRGDIRVRIRRSFQNAPQSPFFMQRMDGETRIITTDIKGQIRALQRNGRVQTQSLENLSEDHYFLYDAFSSSRDFDYIFFDQGYLRVLDKQGKLLLESLVDGAIWQAPVVINPGNERFIALADSLNDRIYLYKYGSEQVHKVLDGRFPPVLIDLDQDLKPEVLTADRNKLILQALEE